MSNLQTERAVLGGGCFWCTEATFQMLKGVLSVTPGYAGGETVNPTYEKVSSGSTGHAEVVQIEFDPSVISYTDLLTVFFNVHDPTQLNRQGADVGTQYRSIILYTTETQKETAEAFMKTLVSKKAYEQPIRTELQRLEKFYPAEEYHKNYFKKNPDAAYCQIVIQPKVEKLEKKFTQLIAGAYSKK
jgi:peptide-methionine (S)-S-oxide reductase